MRIGRNDMCPCGSQRKYKKCHGAPAAHAAIPRQVMIDVLRTEPSPVCLCPAVKRLQPCQGVIVDSHTLQRNGGLSELAREGHVYHFKPDFMNLEKTGGKFVAIKTGIRKCSTFRGFCSLHDCEIFRPIEAVPILPDCEQAYLFGFRAVSREVYAKRRRSETERENGQISRLLPCRVCVLTFSG